LNILELIILLHYLFGFLFFPKPLQKKYYLFTNILLILAFVILLIRKGRAVFKTNDYPLWVFLIAISINVLFAQSRLVAFKTYLDLAIPMFSIYYLVSEDFCSSKKFNLLAKTICLFSIIVSLGGIFESLFAFNPIYEHFIKNPYYQRYITGFVRPMSTQFNPAPLGGYLLGCLPFNYLLFRKYTSFFRLLGAIGVVLSTIVVILTFSRCALLGLIAMIVFYLFTQKNYRAIAILFITVFILIFISSYMPYPLNKFGIDGIIGGGQLSTYRLDRFGMALRMVKDYPFKGVGFQHFRIRFYEYYPYKDKIPYEIMIADNMYLTILSETGIIGFLGFSGFIFSFLRKGWRKLRMSDANSEQRWRLLVTLMAFIGLLVDMVGYEFLYWPNQYLLFCIVVGCLSASLRCEKE